MNVKGQLGNIQGIIFSLIIVGVLIGAGFFILGSFHSETVAMTGSNTSSSALGINKTLNAFQTIPDLLPLIILIALIVVILALVFLIPGARSGGA